MADEITAPYWEAARRHRFTIQRCTRCGRRFHPPVPVCAECNSPALAFDAIGGTGTIETFVIVHDDRVNGFEDLTPYVIAWVRLDDDPDVIVATNLFDVDPHALTFGEAVEVCFEDVAEDVTLPQFRLRRSEP